LFPTGRRQQEATALAESIIGENLTQQLSAAFSAQGKSWDGAGPERVPSHQRNSSPGNG
jgi:hypothetical protein